MHSRLFFLSITGVLLASSLLAQVPDFMSYQAVARDENGECLADQTISLQISIIGDSIDGPVVYKERFEGNVETNALGHFQVEIGSGLSQTGSEVEAFQDIRWNNRTHFLKIEYAPGATTAFTEVGTSQFLSVPYARTAGNGKIFDNNSQEEYLPIYGSNGLLNVILAGNPDETGGDNSGAINLYDGEQKAKMQLFTTSSGGWLYTRGSGENNNRNVELSVFSGADYPNKGSVRIRDEEDRVRAWTDVQAAGAGFLNLYGPNGQPNIVLGTPGNNQPDYGAMTLRDNSGNSQVSLFIDSDGNGQITADGANGGVKSFVMPHPNRPGKDIVYACIEGPEAAAYERGTADLINGEAFIPFSETFSIVANQETMTVMTSPWSSESKGLAVVERTEAGFRVKELHGGAGNYRFDWEVKAVRKGWEDFKVIRDDPSKVQNDFEKYRNAESPITQPIKE